jgi:hypothetical protein
MHYVGPSDCHCGFVPAVIVCSVVARFLTVVK